MAGAEYMHAVLGSARVPLNSIRFWEPRLFKKQNVERLLMVFQTYQVSRLPVENQIPVLISESHLSEVLRDSRLTVGDLGLVDPPFLPVTKQRPLLALRGVLRGTAAQRYFRDFPSEQWWTVLLIRAEGMWRPIGLGLADQVAFTCTPDLQRNISEAHDNSQPYLDGDVFFHIRQSQLDNDQSQVGK